MVWTPLWLWGCSPLPVELPERSDSGGPDAGCGAGVCIAPPPGSSVAHHRVVVDEAGVAWVSWVETEDLRPAAIRLAASPAPGEPLGDLIEVPAAEPPVVGGSEKPSLDVFQGRLAIGHTGTGRLRHGDAVAVHVIHGTVAGTQVEFADPVLIDITNVDGWVAEHAMVALGSDDAWLLYKRQVYGSRDVPTFARDATAYEPELVSDALSRSHECSPPHLVRGHDGAMLLALRSNLSGTLHTVVLTQQGNGFSAPVQVSQGGWTYSPLVCPPDGPRLATSSDGSIVATWVAPHDSTLRSRLTWSTDGGATWHEPELDHAEVGLSEMWPTVTTTQEDHIVTSIEVPGGDTWVFTREELGQAPTGAPLRTPDGGQLSQVEIASRGGRTVALGAGPEGRLWLLELP